MIRKRRAESKSLASLREELECLEAAEYAAREAWIAQGGRLYYVWEEALAAKQRVENKIALTEEFISESARSET